MPLSSLDIMFYYTGDATGPSNNHLSLGGTLGSATIPNNVANNIFDDVTGDESELGDVEYRGIAVYIGTVNSGGSYDAINPKIWISGYSRAASNYDVIYFAKSTFALNSNTMGTCTDESTAPNETGLSWVQEGSPSNTIDWGSATLQSENWVGIWLMRSVPAGASAYNNRAFTLVFRCETTASPYRYPIQREFVIEWSKLPIKTYKLPIQ